MGTQAEIPTMNRNFPDLPECGRDGGVCALQEEVMKISAKREYADNTEKQ
jgi:hypothetical protein